jgi:hypothetical protein
MILLISTVLSCVINYTGRSCTRNINIKPLRKIELITLSVSLSFFFFFFFSSVSMMLWTLWGYDSCNFDCNVI